jgi:hypothetical protein
MINPLQLYVIWGRPIGVWLAGACLVLQTIGHILLSVEGNESYAALVFVIFLFTASLALLIARRASAALCGTSFFMVGLYKAVDMFVHGSAESLLYIFIWSVVAFAGVAGLIFNRRWFDERIVRFRFPEQ